MNIGLLVACVIFAIIAVWLIGLYNGLVVLRNRFKNAFSQIDVQLKRRYDLIPNLVETAKGYMKHERETLEAVIQARSVALGAANSARNAPTDSQALHGLMQAEGALTSSIGRLMLVAERYPELKADRSMATVMEELTSTENKIAFTRQAYTAAVTIYNRKRETFATNLAASLFGFKEAALFEVVNATEREAVKVSF